MYLEFCSGFSLSINLRVYAVSRLEVEESRNGEAKASRLISLVFLVYRVLSLGTEWSAFQPVIRWLIPLSVNQLCSRGVSCLSTSDRQGVAALLLILWRYFLAGRWKEESGRPPAKLTCRCSFSSPSLLCRL